MLRDNAYILDGLKNGRNAHVLWLEAAVFVEGGVVHLIVFRLIKYFDEIFKRFLVEAIWTYIVIVDNRRPARFSRWYLSRACSEWQRSV